MNDVLRFWIPVIVGAIVLAGISIVLMKRFKEKPICKYIPSLMIWLISFILFIYAIFFAPPMADIGYMIMSMMLGIATFLSFVVTMIIDAHQRNKNKSTKLK